MLTYIIRRLMLMVPTLLGVTAVVFFIMAMAPGGFGGSVLNEQGAQTEGDEARRIREYFERRYGLDQPAIVQYGRWLNQVSPLGFLNTSQVTFADEQEKQVYQAIAVDSFLPTVGTDKQVCELILNMARYQNITPKDAVAVIRELLKDTDKGLAWLKILNPKIPARDLKRITESDAFAAQKELRSLLQSQLAGRQRILFSRPAFKWPDLGQSLRGRKVTEMLGQAVPITVLLNVITIPIIYVIAILTGIYAARHRGKWFDVLSGFTLIALWSFPVILAGVLLISYLANSQYLWWFPTAGLHSIEADTMRFLPALTDSGFERGWLLDTIWHLVLPVFCLTYGGFAVLSKLTRGAVLDNIRSDYVRTVRAKGVSEHDVLFRHVMRNSLLPLITVAASIIPALFVGAVVVENIFSIPGMGKLGVEAAFMKDRELLMGTTLIGGMIGLCSEIMRDILYAMADPRVSYE
ncbi:ABC transporter permease [bacterium AH-315-I18]|nr:ABC transporter permease [bacterium AH-315-I18]